MTKPDGNAIDAAFSRLQKENRTALIPFLTVGDPDLATTVDIIKQLELAGADMLELGVPYSDPLADGPVIQRASQRALAQHVTIIDCLRTAGAARAAGVNIPFILFSYYNPVLQLGFARLFRYAAENGISGFIIPDLPPEEAGEMRRKAKEHGMHLIPLVAPTSKDRVQNIAANASGFVYCVSSLGVTGMRSTFAADIEEFIGTVKSAALAPVAIGFGISTNEHFRRFAGICDGVIVGSAIVRKIEEVLPLLSSAETRAAGLRQIGEFVAGLKA
ncbi:MAG TPA: tryptophan synthase subunit alpha [Bacilli bacterium]